MSQEQQQQVVGLDELGASQPLRTHTTTAAPLNLAPADGSGIPLGFQPTYQKTPKKCHNCHKCKHEKCSKRKENSDDKGLSPEELQSMLSKGQLSVVQINSIWDACKLGSLQHVQQYLTENPLTNLNELDNDHASLLHWAAYKGFTQIVEYLISKGADKDIQTSNEGQTPLHWAAISGRINTFHTLCKEGADITITDSRGYNVLHHAVQYGKIYPAFYALNKGIDVNSRDKDGHTALHWAAYRGHLNMIFFLIKRGADVNALDANDKTPLHWAAGCGHIDCVKALIRAGADPNLKSKDGETAEQLAGKKFHTGVVVSLSKAAKCPSSESDLYRYDKYWSAGVFLGIPLAAILICYVPLLINIGLVVIGRYFLKKYVANTFPSDIKTNIWAAFYYSAWAVTSFSLYFKILPAISEYSILKIFCVLGDAYIVVIYTKLFRSDPGVIPKNTFTQEVLEKTLDTEGYLGELCPSCCIIKPARSKHCRSCDKCVARFDHHCVWVGNCVGCKNHPLFLGFVMSIIPLHILFIIVSGMYLHTCNNVPPVLPLVPFVYYTWVEQPLTIVTVVIHGLLAVWEFYLCASHIAMVMENSTTNEMANWYRYPLMKNPTTGQKVNPFNLGSKQKNVKEFLFGGRDWFTFQWVDLLPPEARKMPENYMAMTSEV